MGGKWNVVELSSDGLYAHAHRGFLLVMDGNTEVGRVILDELNCVILSASRATLSTQLIARLAQEGIPIITCNEKLLPVSLTLPFSSNYKSKCVLEAQIAGSIPLKKRLWQKLVKAKIAHQAEALEQLYGRHYSGRKRLWKLAEKVKSGDPENCEAQAAKLYWPMLFDAPFRRDQDSPDYLNSALNYGYTVLRAATARAVVAVGLNPSLGVFHTNQRNPFCLVDDLMEPYRPVIDVTVRNMQQSGSFGTADKAALVAALQRDVRIGEKDIPVAKALYKLCSSLAGAYEDKLVELVLPAILFPGPSARVNVHDQTQGSEVGNSIDQRIPVNVDDRHV